MYLAPIYYRWNAEQKIMVPLERFKHRCEEQFEHDHVYRLIVEQERSRISHDHFHASLAEIWKNLPEDIAERFIDVDHMRRWCLIRTGYATRRDIVLATPADAQRVSAFIGQLDPYAVVVVKGNVVAHFIAESQSYRSMDKERFQASKKSVLDLACSFIGVTPKELATHVKQQEGRPTAEEDHSPEAASEQSTSSFGAARNIEEEKMDVGQYGTVDATPPDSVASTEPAVRPGAIPSAEVGVSASEGAFSSQSAPAAVGASASSAVVSVGASEGASLPQPAEPRTVPEYWQHLRRWAATMKGPAAETRYVREAPLRRQCGVTAAEAREMQAELHL